MERASQITKNIWLGNRYDAIDDDFLRSNNIRYIINATNDIITLSNTITYRIPIINHKTFIEQNLYNYEKGVELIENILRKKNGNILIHCKKGHRRSASLVTAFLMKYYQMSFKNALYYVQHRRKDVLYIQPKNIGLFKSLHIYEEYVHTN